MSGKFKATTAVLLLAAAILAVGLGLIRNRGYLLNRSLRNIALRLVQIERLSQTTGVDYRVTFRRESLVIEVFDPESRGWRPYLDKPYSGAVRCSEISFAFIFSRGFFNRFDPLGTRVRPPRYVIIELEIPGSSRRVRLMFHGKGDWRVLG